nr:MAG TPA: hypothetical protein [Caudoviricetes sp.]
MSVILTVKRRYSFYNRLFFVYKYFLVYRLVIRQPLRIARHFYF